MPVLHYVVYSILLILTDLGHLLVVFYVRNPVYYVLFILGSTGEK